jgi:hypothetical protein
MTMLKRRVVFATGGAGADSALGFALLGGFWAPPQADATATTSATIDRCIVRGYIARVRIAVFLCLVLVSCVPGPTTSRKVSGPTGAGWTSIECPGSHQSCIDKAAALCPDGYDLGTSGGATETNGPNGPGGKYTGHMLIKCNGGPARYRNVHASGCKFQIPNTWAEDEIEGSIVYHPRGSFSTQVGLEVMPHTGTLQSYAMTHHADCKVDATALGDRSAVLATRVDELNGLRITTVVMLDKEKAYALTCAASPPESLSETCRRVLASLRPESTDDDE